MKRDTSGYMAAILSEIEHIWSKYPELRLGQLISNAVSPMAGSFDTFYWEDADLLDALRKFSEKMSSQQGEDK